jgi:hypothetical protein
MALAAELCEPDPAVHLPGRDARLDHERKVDAAKAEFARRADEQARQAAQQAQDIAAEVR